MSLLISSRRKPYPFDLIIGSEEGLGGVGCMLRADDNGGMLVGARTQSLEAQPISYEYGSQTPFLERTYPFKKLVRGMGQRIQEDGLPKRYYYALNADLSINGRWMKGPKFVSQTVTALTTNDIVGVTRALYDGSEVLFVAAGQYLFYRVRRRHQLRQWHGHGWSFNHADRFWRVLDHRRMGRLRHQHRGWHGGRADPPGRLQHRNRADRHRGLGR